MVILGKTGKNFGAGMSGGLAYVFDPDRRLPDLCNEDVAGDLFPITNVEVSALPSQSSVSPVDPTSSVAPSALLYPSSTYVSRSATTNAESE